MLMFLAFFPVVVAGVIVGIARIDENILVEVLRDL